MAFTVNIQQFEGPLDLMLHLIKEKELDLFDLDISVLTDQYLSYIRAMEDLRLEVESEYLVELAGLIEYKSKKLLPKDTSELDSEYQEDPKERLIRRLLEYQQFKDISDQLNESYLERRLHHGKPLSVEVEQWTTSQVEHVPVNGTPYELVKAMMKCMRRMKLSQPIETRFTQKELSVEDRILQIKSRFLSLPKTFSFEQLLEDCTDLHMSIVTFLAVLDLAKQSVLFFTIDDKEQIWFKRGEN